MYSSELHLTKKGEYECPLDDLNFVNSNRNNPYKSTYIRVRKPILLRIVIVITLVLLSLLLIYLVLSLRPLDKSFETSTSSKNTFSGLSLYSLPNRNHLIKFNTFIKASYQPYSDNIETILREYWQSYVNNSQLEDCSVFELHSTKENCIFWREELGSCIHLKNYGYAEGRPCVLLSLDLPENTVPSPLKENSSLVKKYLPGMWSDDHVPVTCSGETEADTKYLIKQDLIFKNSITYSPLKGYSLDFFPKSRSPQYLPPLLMVQFNTLQAGLTVNIQCRAWAVYRNASKVINSVVKFQLHMN